MLVTKDFKKDLKKADLASFFFKDGEVEIHLVEKEKSKGSWKKSEVRNVYKQSNSGNSKRLKATFINDFIQHGTMQVLHTIIKIGDELLFKAEENNNNYLTDAKLHHDELYCVVMRKGKRVYNRILLEWNCCPSNSARAIQAGGKYLS